MIEARHLWRAGPTGQWVEDREGDTHGAAWHESQAGLMDMEADGLALKGEIKGRVALTWVASMGTFWGDAWDAFATAQPRLLAAGCERLRVWAWDTRKTAVIALGPLRGPEGLKGQAPMVGR